MQLPRHLQDIPQFVPDESLPKAEQEALRHRQDSLDAEMIIHNLLGHPLDKVLMPSQFPDADTLKSLTNDGTTEMLTAVRGMFYGLMYESQMDKQVSG